MNVAKQDDAIWVNTGKATYTCPCPCLLLAHLAAGRSMQGDQGEVMAR